MYIQEINNKNIWENTLKKKKQKTFLDSWNWGEFNKSIGNSTQRLAVLDNNKIELLTLIIKIRARRGNFLFIPHGPVIVDDKLDLLQKKILLKTLLSKIKDIAQKEHFSFIRIAPILPYNIDNEKLFSDLGFRRAPLHIHPEVTWVLDIQPDEETLLRNMRKTTRYLIRKAKKEEVKIEQSTNIDDVQIFDKLYSKTVQRHHFVPFSLNYLKNEFKSFIGDNQIIIFLAKYKEEILASAMIIFWQDIAFYHQGASSNKHPKIPAAYLLQWEAIKEAKRRGCRQYNFWGIVPQIKKIEDLKKPSIRKHPWWGLSLFKIGFGGKREEYVKTQDLPLSWKYWATSTFEKIRKYKRHL